MVEEEDGSAEDEEEERVESERDRRLWPRDWTVGMLLHGQGCVTLANASRCPR